MKKLGKILAVMMGALTVFSLTSCDFLLSVAVKGIDANDEVQKNKQDYTLDMELNVPDQDQDPYGQTYKRTVWFKKSGSQLKVSNQKYNDPTSHVQLINWGFYLNLGGYNDVTSSISNNVITFTFKYNDDSTITNQIAQNKECYCTLKLNLNLNEYHLKVMHGDDDISNSVSVNYIKVNGTSYTRRY